MSIPGNAESGAFSRPMDVQRQQSIHFSSAIPIKKRRFPVIQSPSPEEKPLDSEDGSLKNKQESSFSAEGPSLSDVKEKPSASEDNDSGNKGKSNFSEEVVPLTDAKIMAMPEEKPSGSEDDNLKNKPKLKISDERQSLADVKVGTFPEEKPCSPVDNDLMNKQKTNIPDEGLPAGTTSAVKDRLSPGHSDAHKSSAVIVKEEQVSPEQVELQQVNVGILASKPHVTNPFVGVPSTAELRNKMDLILGDKRIESVALENSMNRTVRVKQEVSSAQVEAAPRLELSMRSMNVELSLGPKESVLPGSEYRSSDANCSTPAKSDPTLLSLVSGKLLFAVRENYENTTDKVSSGDSSNRSHWDLNTTMDVWEGSSISNPIGHCQLVDIGNFSKANVSSDIRSDLIGADPLNKGKQIWDDHTSYSSNSTLLTDFQDKADDPLGLRLATPNREVNASREIALSNKLLSVSVGPQLNLGQVRLSAMNVNRAVKSEPLENSRHDFDVGSSSSSNIGLSKFSPLKRELVNSFSLDAVLPSSQLSVDQRSMKSEVVEGPQNAGNCDDDNLRQSVARVMQHQESSASSSAPPPMLPQNSGPSRLPTCEEFSASGDVPNQSEISDHGNELHSKKDNPDEQVADMESQLVSQDDTHLKVGNVVNSADECKRPQVDGCTDELCLPANDDERINIPAEIHEEDYFGSDSESQEMDIEEENVSNKEDEEFEDGEVREPGQSSIVKNIVAGRKSDMPGLVQHSPNLQFSGLGNDNINASDFEEKNPDKTIEDGDTNKDRLSISYEPNNEDDTSKNLSDQVIGGDDGKGSVSVASEKQERNSGKEVSCGSLVKVSHGKRVALGFEATKTFVKGINSEENDSTLSKEEISLNDHDGTKESNMTGSKSRIINLPRSVVTTPGRSTSIPNRLPTSRTGKGRYSDLDGEIQPRGNRDEFYIGGSNKFARERIHDRSIRNPRQGFMRGKGRSSGRFGSFRREWEFNHDFESEGYRGQSDYQAIRRKHASISIVDFECNSYGVPQDGCSRRKEIDEEFHSLRRTSIRRLSAGDRDGAENRGIPMLRRIPRNMSPSQCIDDECSDMPAPRHGNKFMQHLSEDVIDPVFDHQQAMYDDLDGHFARGNRNFSTLHRNGYPRVGSKSPVRSRTRSPASWASPRRRSPIGPPEMLYRAGRMRSPEHPCFRDEMISRRRPSPSYVTRHLNDSRDVVSRRDRVHFKSPNGNRRSSPGRPFPRHARRADALNPPDMGGDSNEYMTGPIHSNKFHEHRTDESIDDRRNFVERHGSHRPFRPNYNTDMDNFPFQQNDDGARPFRFCPDMDTEFVERRNMREREFDAHTKHPPRRTRNIEEQQDGNYRTMERVWHEDTQMKRIRF